MMLFENSLRKTTVSFSAIMMPGTSIVVMLDGSQMVTIGVPLGKVGRQSMIILQEKCIEISEVNQQKVITFYLFYHNKRIWIVWIR